MENTKNTHSYYKQNKAIIKQRLVERRRSAMNIDRCIDAHRSSLVYNLMAGRQHFLSYKTMLNYSIALNPKTIKPKAVNPKP